MQNCGSARMQQPAIANWRGLLASAVIAYRVFFSQPKLPPLKSASSATVAGGAAKANGHLNGVPDASATPRQPMSILFGSQSGTAEAFARELAEEAAMLGYAAAVKDLQDWDAEVELPRAGCAVFLLATFGEGEPTDNAASFYSWINEERRTEQDAAGVPFAVFALGNRQYEHFCKVRAPQRCSAGRAQQLPLRVADCLTRCCLPLCLRSDAWRTSGLLHWAGFA